MKTSQLVEPGCTLNFDVLRNWFILHNYILRSLERICINYVFFEMSVKMSQELI
jgi:hypothetical protein